MELERWQSRFETFLRLGSFSKYTIANYRAELAPFFAYLEQQGLTSLGQITRALVEGYRTHLFYATNQSKGREGRLTLGRQANRMIAVKAFLRFLTREGYLLVDPAAGVRLPRAPQEMPRTLLSEEETARLLEAPDPTTLLGLRDRAILELLYGTGIRNGELVALKLDAVDPARLELRIHRGKGNKSRVVPLGEEALGALELYLEHARPPLLALQRGGDEGWLFLSRRGRALGRNAVIDLVRLAAETAQLEKKVTPHALRHCCATHMLRHGAGLRHLQVMLGHATASTTQLYTKVETSDLRSVMLRCHPREKDLETP